MDNNSNNNDEEKPRTTLDLENVSISTLKSDLNKENDEANESKGRWLGFLKKHQETDSSSVLPARLDETGAPEASTAAHEAPANGQFEPTAAAGPEPPDSFLDKELDRFKADSEKPAVAPPDSLAGEDVSVAGEAPPNLPVAESPARDSDPESLQPVYSVNPSTEFAPGETKKFNSDAEDVSNTDAIPDISNIGAAAGVSNVGETSDISAPIDSERPALGSFFPKKESEPEEAPSVQNELAKALAGGGPMKNFKTEESEPESEENKNPFSAHLPNKEGEKGSLIQAVESALNYSAPPEFSEQREVQENQAEEESRVVDLRKKAEAKSTGLLKSKKTVIIFGGVGGLVLILVFTTFLFLGGKGTEKPKVATPAVQGNKNQNTNAAPPIKQIITTPTKPTITPQKVLANAEEINIGSTSEISTEIEKIRQGRSVSKQTQLIFVNSDGSTVSFQDLANALNINISQKVLSQPNSVPALFLADFFHGQTIFGMIIPTEDSESAAETKMRDWEKTMVSDLDQLWKGIPIDNPGAYFADSGLFDNGRFALIDKKDKLSLDYMISGGYIFITCGKDSMSILQDQFTGISAETSGSGIKWDEGSGAAAGANTGVSTGTGTSGSGNAGSATNNNTGDISVGGTGGAGNTGYTMGSSQ